MATMLQLTGDLPEVEMPPGHVLVTEGAPPSSVYVLVSGSLDVVKSGAKVNVIDQPGAVIGEIAVMLERGASASVVAAQPSVVRVAEDGGAFLRRSPEVAAHVAAGLARRLDIVTTYLADLKNQYGDAPGLAMVGEVLGKLTSYQGPAARPGSAREPDPEY